MDTTIQGGKVSEMSDRCDGGGGGGGFSCLLYESKLSIYAFSSWTDPIVLFV